MNYINSLYYYLRLNGINHNAIKPSHIPFSHLTVMLKGCFVFKVDGVEYSLKENDAIFIPSGSLRERIYSSERCEYAIFNFSFTKEKAITNCIHFKNAVTPFIRNILDSYTYKYYSDTAFPYDFYKMPNQNVDNTREQEKIKSILHNVLNCVIIELLDTLNYSTENRHVVNTVRYINDNITETVSLTSISNNIHISKEYLARLFKKEMNMTVTEYIAQQKLIFAKNLLMSDDISLQDIAEKLGYQNYNYFSRIFKKHYGISPLKMKHEISKKT